MSLHTRLLELLSTPAARAASDEDTRRAVARLLVCDGSLGLPPTHPVTCAACGDFEAGPWRRRVELDLGNTEEVKGATHTRLRQMLRLTVEQLGVDLAAAQRERDEAVGALAVATDRLVSLEHQIDVFAMELDAGDLDTLRLRIDEARSSDVDEGKGSSTEAAAVEQALTATGSIAGAAIHLGVSLHEMKVRIVRNRVAWPRTAEVSR